MPVTRCPYCLSVVDVPDEQVAGGTVKCPNPGCRCFFAPGPPPEGPPGEAGFSPWAPLTTSLTSPHECHQCQGPITAATGMARSTILCPLCSRKTSVYAVLHF